MHENIRLPAEDQPRISENYAQLYQDGLSLTDISKQTGKSKNAIRDQLIKAGIALRPRHTESVVVAWSDKGKRNVRPYYGFCYFQGKIVADPREYENLLLIHKLWKQEQNPNSIANLLNAKKIQPRSAKSWNRNSVVLILNRFEQGLITLKGAKYELR